MRKRASALSQSFCRMFIMNSEEEWLEKSIKKIKNSLQNELNFMFYVKHNE